MDRDRWLLESLATLRVMSTRQVLHLGFAGSRSAANKRLRRLFDAGLLRVWVRCLEAENLYTLTAAGRSALADDNGGNILIPRGLDRDLDHTLAINDVRIALGTTLPAIDAELTWWRSDWDLRPHRLSRVIPDALFTLRWADGRETPFSLEVDRNTKSTRAFLRKLLAYRTQSYSRLSLLDSSAVAVLAVVQHPAWLERHRQQLAHMKLGYPVWFATLSDVVTRGAQGDIWRAADREETYSLGALAALPNGSEGLARQTAALASTYGFARARVPSSGTAA